MQDYEYPLPKRKLKRETLIKYYDLIRPTRCVVEESQRYLRLEHEDSESYVSYFTVNAIVGELDFPSSEIFYFQQHACFENGSPVTMQYSSPRITLRILFG